MGISAFTGNSAGASSLTQPQPSIGKGIIEASAVLEQAETLLGLCTIYFCSAVPCSTCSGILELPVPLGCTNWARSSLRAAVPVWLTGGAVLGRHRLSDETNHWEWIN